MPRVISFAASRRLNTFSESTALVPRGRWLGGLRRRRAGDGLCGRHPALHARGLGHMGRVEAVRAGPETRPNAAAQPRRRNPMRPLKRNPAPLAAGRASDWFCLAAERLENSPARSGVQDRRRDFNAVVAGVPDLVVIAPGGRALLDPRRRPSPAACPPSSRAVHDSLNALGTPPAIVRSIDDARLAFAAWGLTTREAGR